LGRVEKVRDSVGTGCKGSGQRWDGLERFGTSLRRVEIVPFSKPADIFLRKNLQNSFFYGNDMDSLPNLDQLLWFYAAFKLRQLKVKEIPC
jgi:hypothetical protein